ncbi:universal stress protein [Chitinophaga lutea]|uniref:Universal stress protein n=1 Tax=Chitinophaga lutea TaxID=2488634 RepID=A0A3N4PL22_9BACT|nr:universal stress protein [Chitinophaga lutea]RPE08906.1 universal stress protein [Chitinophaga lutea]
MKKIIAAVDAFSFTEDELRSYKYLANTARGELTVLFLENLFEERFSAASGRSSVEDATYDAMFAQVLETRQLTADKNKKRLIEFYRDNGDDVNVHVPRNASATECIAESRLADLLLVRNTTTLGWLHDTNPPKFVKDLLAEAECPVMVVPEVVQHIREIIFTYNGTLSSSYAIRQFSQVFDDLSEVPVEVVYVEEGDDKTLPSGDLLKDYLQHHYDRVTYRNLVGTPSAELQLIAIHHKNAVMTFGAYGRSSLSRFFHRSDADSILRTADIPLFITHL